MYDNKEYVIPIVVEQVVNKKAEQKSPYESNWH